MNTNPDAIRILCYGDSNTHGTIPGLKGPRYPPDVRWTGVLQDSLGLHYEIIEEGLSGRTTTAESQAEPEKNGRPYLLPCLKSHSPLDIVIIFLGTNDLKEAYNRSADDIAAGVEELIEIVEDYEQSQEQPLQKLIVCPALLEASTEASTPKYKGAATKSLLLSTAYAEVANRHNCFFLDLGGVVEASPRDGYHFDENGHAQIAKMVENSLKKALLRSGKSA